MKKLIISLVFLIIATSHTFAEEFTVEECLKNTNKKQLLQIYVNNGLSQETAKNFVCADTLGYVENIHLKNNIPENIVFLGSLENKKNPFDNIMRIRRDELGKTVNFVMQMNVYFDENSLMKTNVDCGEKINKRKIEKNEYRQLFTITNYQKPHWTLAWVDDFRQQGFAKDPLQTNFKTTMSTANLIQFSCPAKNKSRILGRSFYTEKLLMGEKVTNHPVHPWRKHKELGWALLTFPPYFLPIPERGFGKGLKFMKSINDFVCTLPDNKFIDKTNQNDIKACLNPRSKNYLGE